MAWIRILLGAMGLLIFLSFYGFASADSGDIYINEVMWNGSSVSSADEWIELYNPNSGLIDLGGYSLFDEIKNEEILKIQDGQIAGKGNFLISNNSQDHVFSGGQSILSVEPDLVDSGLSISNANLKITLRDESGAIKDVVGDGGRPFFYDFKRSSMYRKNYDINGADVTAWAVYQVDPSGNCLEVKNLDDLSGEKECATPTPSGRPVIKSLSLSETKFEIGSNVQFLINFDVFDAGDNLDGFTVIDNANNLTKTYSILDREISFGILEKCPKFSIRFFDRDGLYNQEEVDISCYELSDQVWISEVLPHPSEIDWDGDQIKSSKDEWIEIVNAGRDSVSLDGWYLMDEAKRKFFLDNYKLGSLEYLTLFQDQTKISVNDSGDKIYLLSPDDNVVSIVTVPSSSSKKDLSFAKWADKWYWTKNPTPGLQNIINEPGDITNPTTKQINEARGKNASVTAKIVETERSSFTALYQDTRIDVQLTGGDLPKLNESVEIGGELTGGGIAKIFSSQVIVKNPAGSGEISRKNELNANSSSSQYFVVTTTRRIKTIKKKKLLSSVVLKDGKKSVSHSSKHSVFVIYLSSLFSFLSAVLLYEFCCRE